MKLANNKKFIEYYFNTTTFIKKSKDEKSNFNESMKQASINLSKLFELVLNLAEKGDEDTCNFIRWNFGISCEVLNKAAGCSDNETINKQRSLFIQLKKKYVSLINEKANKIDHNSFFTKYNEVKNTVNFINKRIQENKIHKELVKKSIQQLVLLYSSVIEVWPFHHGGVEVDTANVKKEIKELNDSICSILNLANLKSQRDAIMYSFNVSIEVFENEKSLGGEQFKQIVISLSMYNETLRESHFRQILEKCGDEYDKLKQTMSKLIENAISFKNIVLSPILHPIEFFKNCCYALKNIKKVGKECGSYIKNHPVKSAAFIIGVIGIGIGLSFLTAGLASSIIPFAAFNLAITHIVGVGGISLISSSAVVSVAGNAIKTAETEFKDQIIESYSENQMTITDHAEAINEAKKAYFEKINKKNNCIDEKLKDDPIAIEIKNHKDVVLQTIDIAKELLEQTKNNLDILEEEEENTLNSFNHLSNISNLLETKTQRAKEELLKLSNFEITSYQNNVLTKESIEPLFDKWFLIFKNKGSYKKLSDMANLMEEKKYNELFDWLKEEDELYQPYETHIE